jgi:hypothetical protein
MKNKSKPVQRSLAHLKKNGWQVAIVERYIKAPGMKFGRRIDVHGFGDLLACRPAIVRTGAVTPNHKTKVILKPAIALVQCCRDGDFAEHRAKIMGTPMEHWTPDECEESKEVFAKFQTWKASGGRVFLQGWGFKGPRGEKKRWTLREEEL